MKTELINIDNVPSDKELTSLLGTSLFTLYLTLNCTIVAKFNPNLEIWDKAGRRGKYYHGYRINTKSLLWDFFLSPVNNGQVKCQLKLSKNSFEKLLRKKDSFSEQTRQSMRWSEDYRKEYGEIYLNIILNEETLDDALHIIQILA